MPQSKFKVLKLNGFRDMLYSVAEGLNRFSCIVRNFNSELFFESHNQFNWLSGQVHLDPDTAVYAGHTDGLKPTLSVAENLRFWADIFGTQTITDSLRLFGLEALQTRLAGSLSAGQKRRLGLSRLWLAKRRVWLLDEPTVSLDQQAVGQFAAMVGAHLQAGGAAVIATHIDLGFDARAQILDLAQFKAKGAALERADEAFL